MNIPLIPGILICFTLHTWHKKPHSSHLPTALAFMKRNSHRFKGVRPESIRDGFDASKGFNAIECLKRVADFLLQGFICNRLLIQATTVGCVMLSKTRSKVDSRLQGNPPNQRRRSLRSSPNRRSSNPSEHKSVFWAIDLKLVFFVYSIYLYM